MLVLAHHRQCNPHLHVVARPAPLPLQVDPTKIVWTPFNAERDYQNFAR